MIQEGSKYYLNSDAIGIYSGNTYALKGDKVLLIAIHNNMVIVEYNRTKFPARLDQLTDNHQEKELSATVVREQIFSKRKIKKKAKTNSSLF
jgi:hypothetical protein